MGRHAYHHVADVKGHGVDCAMLLVRVYCDLGLVERFDPRPYTRDWILHRSEEKLSRLPARARARGREPGSATSSCSASGGCFAHAGIVSRDRSVDDHSRLRASAIVLEDVVAIKRTSAQAEDGEIRELLGLRIGLSSHQRQRQARFHVAAGPDLDLDHADPDHMGPEQGRAEFNLVSEFPCCPGGRAARGSAAKGGLFGGGASANSYTYTADLIMALCEGPIAGVGLIWKDQSIYVPIELGLAIFPGTTPQAVWSYLAAEYPFNALAYQGTAIAVGSRLQPRRLGLDRQPQFRDHRHPRRTGVNGVDADPALVIQDFLTNAQYGCGFNPASIDSGSLFTMRGFVPDLLRRDGLCVLAGSGQSGTGLEHPDAVAADLLDGGGVERRPPQIHPLRGHSDLAGRRDRRISTQFSVPIPIPASSGVSLPRVVTVAPPAKFVSDGGVVYAFSNIPFTFIGA